MNAKRGDTVKLECNAAGDAPLTVTWLKESSKLHRSEKYDITEDQTKEGIRSELTIRMTGRDDGGMYVCIAENSFGKDEKTNKLVVLEAPAAPTSLSLSEVWSRSASISWSAPFVPNIPITGYVIQFWKKSNNGENNRLQEQEISSTHTSFMLKNLQPGAHYEVKVLAMNDVGRGPTSTGLRIRTGEEEPATAPLDVFAEAEGPTTVRVSWKSLPPDQWNGNPVGFYVGFRLTSDPSRPYTLRTVPYMSNTSTYEHFLSQLNKGAQYSIIVKAYNFAGSGPESEEAVVRTMSEDLLPAPKVQLSGVTTDSVSLMFRLRQEEVQNVQLTGFIVHYRADSVAVWKEVSIPVSSGRGEGNYMVKELSPNSIYFFYVTAINNQGQGDPSELLTIKTRVTDTPLLGGRPFMPGERNTVMFGHYQQDLQTYITLGAAVIAIITVIVAYVCVKKAKLQAQKPPVFPDYMPAGSSGRGSETVGAAYVETMRRYVEHDTSGKPLMQGNVFVRQPTHGHELKSFPASGMKSKNGSRNQAYMLQPEVYDYPQ